MDPSKDAQSSPKDKVNEGLHACIGCLDFSERQFRMSDCNLMNGNYRSDVT
jgi:hypothetical protein